jgi:hypothetical protein
MSAFSASDLVAASLLCNMLSERCKIDFHQTNTVYVGNYSGLNRYQEVLAATSLTVLGRLCVAVNI